jgi:rRNA-processing protein FCF1
MKQIILDTNFLVNCLSWKVDFFSEIRRICDFPYKLAVIDKTVEELDNLIKEGRQEARLGARLAKQLIAKNRIEVIPTTGTGHADKRILAIADKNTVVATQDQALKRALKTKGIPTIIIRQKKYLQCAEK